MIGERTVLPTILLHDKLTHDMVPSEQSLGKKLLDILLAREFRERVMSFDRNKQHENTPYRLSRRVAWGESPTSFSSACNNEAS